MRKYLTEQDKKDIEKRCNTRAKEIVDQLCDNNILDNKLRRASLRVVEKILSNEMNRTIKSEIECRALLDDIGVKGEIDNNLMR